MKTAFRFGLLFASLLFLSLGRPEAVAAPLRTFPFWACSDGKGTATLFWLPPDGRWPAGGFRLERIVRKQRVLLAKALGPGLDGEALAALPPADAERIRALGDTIRGGALTDEERRHSISVMGKAAATDVLYGRALGVRYTDRGNKGGKLLYRLTALDADGKPGGTMESNEVDPSKRTPGPSRPSGLAAEERPGAVALAWSDPPASVLAPVVAFRVERAARRGKSQILTPTPLVLNRHLTQGRPDFLDADPPREPLEYGVRSIDIFGRMSTPTRVAISAKTLASAEKTPQAAPLASEPPEEPAPAAPKSGAVPAPPVEPSREEEIPAPDPGSRAEPVVARTEDSVPVATASRDEPAPSAKPPGKDAYAAIPLGPKPSPTGRSEAEPSAAVPSKPSGRPESGRTAEALAREAGPPPPPTIVSIVGLGHKVSIAFRPGEPQALSSEFLVYRSESPAGPGVVVGRPVPGDARQWEDPTVEAGQYFWYRLVAVDRAGNRSAPSNPKWVGVGSH